MSAAPRQSDIDAFGYYGLRMGAQDFLDLGQTRERYELIHGVVSMSPRPTLLHQRLLSLIQFQLEHYVQRNPGACYWPDVDLVVSKDTVYAPDVVVYAPGRITRTPERLNTPPDLVIEIMSYGTKAFDLTTKHDDYEGFGVAEYWTYDPADRSARSFRREGGKFLMSSVQGDSLASIAVPGLMLDLRPLRAAGD